MGELYFFASQWYEVHFVPYTRMTKGTKSTSIVTYARMTKGTKSTSFHTHV